jgi:hypothetical protein
VDHCLDAGDIRLLNIILYHKESAHE